MEAAFKGLACTAGESYFEGTRIFISNPAFRQDFPDRPSAVICVFELILKGYITSPVECLGFGRRCIWINTRMQDKRKRHFTDILAAFGCRFHHLG